jgi:hypothetical protein
MHGRPPLGFATGAITGFVAMGFVAMRFVAMGFVARLAKGAPGSSLEPSFPHGAKIIVSTHF